jgi:ribosome biogenesis GTPase
MNMTDLGWSDLFEQHFEPFGKQGLVPARVAQEHKQRYVLYCEKGEVEGEVSGKLRHEADSKGEFPAVGDWVAVSIGPGEQKAIIHAILPRRSCLLRKAVLSGGRTEEQVLAANLDVAFLVSGLDGELNLRRIERYLSVVWEGETIPVIVLNKMDVCDDVDQHLREAASVAPGVPVHAISAARNEGLAVFQDYLGSGKTGAFLGSSGVGKSTIVNALLGSERLKVAPVRDYDKKGRHTTSGRELFLLPSGGMVIDTPGMRELGMWNDQSGLSRTFDDVEELARGCRFRDCRHQGEPGCAVQQAIAEGLLDVKRLGNYLKLKRELARLAVRKDQRARLNSKRRWRQIAMARRQVKKRR